MHINVLNGNVFASCVNFTQSNIIKNTHLFTICYMFALMFIGILHVMGISNVIKSQLSLSFFKSISIVVVNEKLA